MIKMMSKDGKSVFFGLSEMNLQLLRARKPIVFAGDEVGFPGFQICIFYGDTEESMSEELTQAGIVAPQTTAAIDAAQKELGGNG